MNEGRNRQNILIVDDAPQNISVLGSLLKDEYNIRVANNGEKALEIVFSSDPPDLILLDIIMPGINGFEVCKKIKSEPKTQNIPIIFITAKTSDIDEVKGFELGAVDYITKPFKSTVVRARVRTHADLKRYRDLLEHQSNVDGLTGISNRRFFNEYAEGLLKNSDMKKMKFGLIMMDIDFFKKYNDTYGHYNGDICLQSVAKRLQDSLMDKEGVLARYGGEEFVCILHNIDRDSAVDIAETLRKAVESLCIPHSGSDASEFVTLSLGVTTFEPGQIGEMSIPIDKADEGLYLSKSSGRNKVTYKECNI